MAGLGYTGKELARTARRLSDELDALRQLEKDVSEWRYFQGPLLEGDHGAAGLDHAHARAEEHLVALEWRLRRLLLSAQVFLEMADLPQTRSKLLADFETRDLRELTVDSYEGETFATSPAREHLAAVLEPLLIAFGALRPTRAKSSSAQRLLIDLLRDTATIVQAYGVVPTREIDIQTVMHRLLKAVFPTFSPSVTLAKPIKSFKPDCCVLSLQTAIEFKFADKQQEIPTEFDQLCADLSGYAGSKDFPFKVAVLYQTSPFISERQLKAAIGMTGHGTSWDLVVVTGPGARPQRKKSRPEPEDKLNLADSTDGEIGGHPGAALGRPTSG